MSNHRTATDHFSISLLSDPITLLLVPLLGAIAAGCTAIVKVHSPCLLPTPLLLALHLPFKLTLFLFPSISFHQPAEQAPSCAALIARLLPKYLDPQSYICITGAIDQTSQLLKLQFDHIFYTGSGNVGKIVSKAAAEHLTPVTLELGGKSPAIVLDDADLDVAARRIIWAKFSNAGQVSFTHYSPLLYF